ncbi:hypothetical protein RRF57_013014 [Xylaria bambusicola]|uniref:Uncharacterized protein n=1 Tax=Xylaria bambusicola TaxID=326684 RepID=A0AAN7UW70_9PEZI
MDSRRDAKKPIANVKFEARHHSPSPERKKRVAEGDEGPKPPKRVKVEDSTSNGTTPRPFKDGSSSQKPLRNIPTAKSEFKDSKHFSGPNGRPTSSNSALRAASPKQTSQVNGTGKTSGQASHKRAVSNGEPVSKTVPRLLSPLFIADLSIEKPSDQFKENTSEPRPSPKKRPVETNTWKPPLKKSRNEREPSPATKKRKTLPPLLSPTLPAIVMEELARTKKLDTPSKESGLKNSQISDSVVVKKPAKSTQNETIHVDNKKEPTKFVVTMKYKKRHAKTIERLLNLPSGGKKKAEGLKKDDQTPRENAASVEPGTARKRPRTAADATEALKRPKTSEALRPSTPPKQSISMSRIASNSSTVGTPGATYSVTPSTQPPNEKRRESGTVDRSERLQRAQRCRAAHNFFMDLGKRLKHERDGIFKHKEKVPEHESQLGLATSIQCLLSYMHAVKLLNELHDLEKLPRRLVPWKEVLSLFTQYRNEFVKSSNHLPFSALVCRVQGIFMSHMVRVLWSHTPEADTAKDFVYVSKNEAEVWRQADQWRRRLGTYDGSSNASDGGVVGKLIDRLGPWSTSEEAIIISLEVLRNAICTDEPWKPADELAKFGRPTPNGAPV